MKFAYIVVVLFFSFLFFFRSLSSSFFKSLYSERQQCIRCEREKLSTYSKRRALLCGRDESDFLYDLFSPMYYLPVLCTYTIDFDQFELQRSLIRINLLPRSSELQVLGIWRCSSELLVFRVFGTWSSESSSLQKLEMFIRTSCVRIFGT